jgi:hypothetical protein
MNLWRAMPPKAAENNTVPHDRRKPFNSKQLESRDFNKSQSML